ncbi:hypothetical protein K1719_023451 [Acacia pycnantha]|nr:hypothetical protein K1719_023451 [Acacia pycnantha]
MRIEEATSWKRTRERNKKEDDNGEDRDREGDFMLGPSRNPPDVREKKERDKGERGKKMTVLRALRFVAVFLPRTTTSDFLLLLRESRRNHNSELNKLE